MRHRQDHRRQAVRRREQDLRRVGDDCGGLEVEARTDRRVTAHGRSDAHDLTRLHEIDLGLEVVEDGVERAALREAAVVPRVRRVAARDGPADARPLAELEKSLRAEAGLLGQAALREREEREREERERERARG